jgi:hypothetical protein
MSTACYIANSADDPVKCRILDANGNPYSSTSTLPVTIYDSDGNDTNRSFDESNYLSTFLLNGANEDMSVDGSTPVEFSYTVPAGKEAKLTRGFVTIEDGATEFSPGDFGAISGALSNGVEVSITPSGGAKVVLETWTTNREIRNTMFDFDNEFRTAGAYVGRWTFGKDLGNSGISLTAGDKFSILVQDNISALTYFSFRLKANIEDV